MGYNSTIIIRNDGLNEIEEDKEFGKKVAAAIKSFPRVPGPIRSGSHANVADVVSVEHADVTSVVAVGGNHGTVLLQKYNSGRHAEEKEQVQLLKDLAESFGFRLVKKS